MRKILIITIFITSLLAQNPRVYSAIGDTIYNNAILIEKLKTLTAYPYDENKIDIYIKRVNINKKIGFKIQEGKKVLSPALYLEKLRELNKTNNDFIRKVNLMFSKSIKNKNTVLFLEMVNSGLLDTASKKKDIMNFYLKHQDKINPAGVIQTFLNEDIELRKRHEYWLKAKKRKEAARIKYLREKDKADEEALSKRLMQKTIQTKKEIRNHQKEELNIH